MEEWVMGRTLHYRALGLSFAVALACVACRDGGATSPAGAAGTGTATSPATETAGTSGAGAAGTTSAAAGATSGGAGRAATGAAGAATSPAAGSGAAGTTAAGAGGATESGGDVTTVAGAGAAGSTSGAAGAAGAGAGGETAAAAGSSGAASMPMMDEGKGDGSDVITIGDSWMNIFKNGGGIEGGLDRLGTKYRHYAVAGTTLINGDIPAQYNRAKAANPKIKTIIMTGGGNDVMFSNGCATKEACTMFAQRIADALDELWTKAAADGVTGTVYINYSRNAGTAPEDTRPDMQPIPKICLSGKLKCLSVDTTDIIARTDLLDGIHPNQAGCDRIAKRVAETMEKGGVRR